MGREGLDGIIWLPQVGKTLRVWRAKVGIQYKDKSWWQRTDVNQSRTFGGVLRHWEMYGSFVLELVGTFLTE